MPKMNISIAHALGQDEATRRLQDRFHSVKDQFGSHISDLEEEWEPHGLRFGFRVMGQKISGSVASKATEVHVAADLPMTALMFKGTIERQIRDELTRMLSG
ncbi:MAG: polyhydroxyalkanoic acid system family protein [Thermoguttaceae bacterium]